MNRIRNGILHATFAVGLLAAVAPVSAEEDRWSSFLPYKKELAGDTELPLPLGVGVIYYEQKQDMQVTDQSFGFELSPILAGLGPALTAAGLNSGQIQALGQGLQGALGQVRPSDVRNEIRHQNIHLDAWLSHTDTQICMQAHKQIHRYAHTRTHAHTHTHTHCAWKSRLGGSKVNG